MAERTVASAFERLLTINIPTDTERSAAVRHRASIVKALEHLENYGLRETGSFTHGTAVRGHADVDVLIRLRGARPMNSGTALERVRNALASAFIFTNVRVSRPAVVVNFAAGAERWEVIPAYYLRTTNDHPVYSIPAPGGNWMETAPTAHLAYVTDANRSPTGGAKGLARLVKTWKYANRSTVKLSSFYLEMRAARRMDDETSFIPHLDFAYLMRDLAAIGLAEMYDPTGLTGRFRAASTDAYRAQALATLAGDAKRVEDAIALEKSGDRGAAFEKLKMVFPGAFPGRFY